MSIPDRLRDHATIKVCPPDCGSHDQCSNPGKRPVEGRYEPRPVAEVEDWVDSGGNAGVVAKGQLVFIDSDVPRVDEVLASRLPPTFTVQSGNGHHYYFECPDWDENVTFKDFSGEIASFRAADQHVVIPPSTHPSGTRYEVVDDRPIRPLEPTELASIKSAITEVVDERIKRERTAIRTLLDELPEDDDREELSLTGDGNERTAIDAVLNLRCRTRSWQMWVTNWVRAAGLPVDGIVSPEIGEMLLEDAKQEGFDRETTLQRIEKAVDAKPNP